MVGLKAARSVADAQELMDAINFYKDPAHAAAAAKTANDYLVRNAGDSALVTKDLLESIPYSHK